MGKFLLSIIALIVAVVWLRAQGAPGRAIRALNRYPYERRRDFLSAAERSFYGVLCLAVEADQVVLAKVRLADLVRVDPVMRGKNFWKHFNAISAKHVDFVVCDRATMEPVYCVELDDKSHQAKRRQDRDSFVDAVMGAAGVRLVRVPYRAGYSVEEVRGMVSSAGAVMHQAEISEAMT